ncbi:MAG TPA: TIGR02117 family protein [Cyclobacteriaceae bacterium]|nr:TIGR02117 family protein [Cyclobacteriaceae bacterium]
MKFFLLQIFSRALAVYLFTAVIFSLVPLNLDFNQDPGGIPVWIISNGVHTDLTLPVESHAMSWDIFFRGTSLYPILKSANYVSFGWGSREFYLNTPEWKDLKIMTAIDALFLEGEPAMHVTALPVDPRTDARSIRLVLPEEDFLKLTGYVKSYFSLNDYGEPIKIDADGYYEPYDMFFEARGSFNLFRTCNAWTNHGLKKSGIRCALWTPFDIPILFHLSSAAK